MVAELLPELRTTTALKFFTDEYFHQTDHSDSLFPSPGRDCPCHIFKPIEFTVMKPNMDRISFFFLMGVMGVAALAAIVYGLISLIGK